LTSRVTTHFCTEVIFVSVKEFMTCPVAQMTESQCASDRNSLSEEPGSIPGPASRFQVRTQGRMLFLGRQEGSMVL